MTSRQHCISGKASPLLDFAINMSKDTEGKSEKIMDLDGKVLWYPDSKRNTRMDTFRMQVNGDYGLNLGE